MSERDEPTGSPAQSADGGLSPKSDAPSTRPRGRGRPSLGLSPSAEARLLYFFSKTSARKRIYLLFLALIRHHSVRTANAMAFDLFLALVPTLGLAGYLAARLVSEDPTRLALWGDLTRSSPMEVRAFLELYFHGISHESLAPIALLTGLWLSSSAFFTLISVFEESFDSVGLTYLKKRALSLALSLLGQLVLAASAIFGLSLNLTSSTWLGRLAESLGFLGVVPLGLALSGFLAITAFIAVLYRVSITRRVKRRIWPGAFLASVVGTFGSFVFAYYASNIARYALFYGSLAAVVILLLWLWLWCSAILLGAEVNVALEDLAALPEAARAELVTGQFRAFPAVDRPQTIAHLGADVPAQGPD